MSRKKLAEQSLEKSMANSGRIFLAFVSERKQREVGVLLRGLNIDVQESWEREGKTVAVDGYRWLKIS